MASPIRTRISRSAALPPYEFDKCVARYHGNFRVRKLPAYEHFLILAFAQLTWRESLRDIETCLASFGARLYHSGIGQPIARSTLADANEKRDWRPFADFAHILIAQATTLYADEPFAVELQAAAYALDATTIDLCLSLFPWAKFRRLLRHPCEEELPVCPSLLPPRGQNHRPAF